MEETLATTGVATRRLILWGAYGFAIMEIAFGAYLGLFRYRDKMTSSWVGIYLLLALVAIAVSQIQIFRLSRETGTSVRVFGLVTAMYAGMGWLLLALAQALK